jgi:hypothetical protein
MVSAFWLGCKIPTGSGHQNWIELLRLHISRGTMSMIRSARTVHKSCTLCMYMNPGLHVSPRLVMRDARPPPIDLFILKTSSRPHPL